VNSAEIDTPVTDPMVISTRLGGIVSVCAPVAASSATRSPGLAPRAFISGNKTGATGRHVGGLGTRDARYQIHRAQEHVVQAAADMAEQAGEKSHHRPRHAGHLDQEPEKHEQRHRQQDEMAHALVHPADQHHQRRVRGQRHIAEDRQSECEGDGNAGEDTSPDHTDEEDHQIEIAEGAQPRLRQPEHADHARHGGEREQYRARPADAQQAEQANTAMIAMPTGRAAARKLLAICSAGVVM